MLSVQVQFGTFSAFLIFGNLISRNPVVVEHNGPKFQPEK